MRAVEADDGMKKVIMMVRRSLVVAAGLLVAVTACGGGDPDVAGTTTVGPTTTAEDHTDARVEAGLVYATRVETGVEVTLDIHVPADPRDAPIVIGPYPDLVEQGMIVVTYYDREYHTGPEQIAVDRGFVRRMDEHVGCTIRFARARASEVGNDDPTVVLSGFSITSGAAAQVALFGDTLDARWDEFAAAGGPSRQLDCTVTDGSTDVDALIGIAGPYDLAVPIFDGEYGRAYQRERDPEMQEFLASAIGANPDLRIHFIHGTRDFIPVANTEEFVALLRDAGYDVQLTTWDGGHDGPPVELLLSALMEVLDR